MDHSHEERQRELQFILAQVKPKLNHVREAKTDLVRWGIGRCCNQLNLGCGNADGSGVDVVRCYLSDQLLWM